MVRHKSKIALKTWSSNSYTSSKSLHSPCGGMTFIQMTEQGSVGRWFLSLSANCGDCKANNRGWSSCLLLKSKSLDVQLMIWFLLFPLMVPWHLFPIYIPVIQNCYTVLLFASANEILLNCILIILDLRRQVYQWKYVSLHIVIFVVHISLPHRMWDLQGQRAWLMFLYIAPRMSRELVSSKLDRKSVV